MPHISFIIEAKGPAEQLQLLREALAPHAADRPMTWQKDLPEHLQVCVELPPGTWTPELDDLDSPHLPGVELAVTRLLPQPEPLPPLRASRMWRAGVWHKVLPTAPFRVPAPTLHPAPLPGSGFSPRNLTPTGGRSPL